MIVEEIGLASQKQDFSFFRGDTLEFNYTILDKKLCPADITGATIWMTAKANNSDADPGIFQKTIGSGITITDPVNGLINVVVDPTDTSSLDDFTVFLFYDVQVKTSIGKIFTVLYGSLSVDPDTTNTTV